MKHNDSHQNAADCKNAVHVTLYVTLYFQYNKGYFQCSCKLNSLWLQWICPQLGRAQGQLEVALSANTSITHLVLKLVLVTFLSAHTLLS